MARAIVTVMRVVGKKESEGGKAMTMATGTRVACNKEGNVGSGKRAGNKGEHTAMSRWWCRSVPVWHSFVFIYVPDIMGLPASRSVGTVDISPSLV